MKVAPTFLLSALVFYSLAVVELKEDDSWGSLFGIQSAQPAQNNKQKTGKSAADPRPTIACATTRRICDNFHRDVQKQINLQITEELKASYVYQAMAFYFSRDDVALHGFSKFFKKASDEEREHAEKLMTYMNKRGGTINLADIPKPTKDSWPTGLAAVKDALNLEHAVNRKLLDLHWIAQQKNDPHLQDFLEGEYLTEQVDSIKQLGDWVTQLTRVGKGLGEHIFDKELLSKEAAHP